MKLMKLHFRGSEVISNFHVKTNSLKPHRFIKGLKCTAIKLMGFFFFLKEMFIYQEVLVKVGQKWCCY